MGKDINLPAVIAGSLRIKLIIKNMTKIIKPSSFTKIEQWEEWYKSKQKLHNERNKKFAKKQRNERKNNNDLVV